MDKKEKVKFVTLKLNIFKEDKEKLAILANIRQKSVNDFVYQLIMNEIDNAPELDILGLAKVPTED